MQAILKAPGPLNGSSCWHEVCSLWLPVSKARRCSWPLAQDVITLWRCVIRIVMSRHGDHTDAYLKELSLTFKLLVIEQIPQPYSQNITKISTKPASWRFNFTFCIFKNVNDDHGTFFNSRIRFLLWPNRLRIDTRTGRFRKNQAFILQMTRTEQSL